MSSLQTNKNYGQLYSLVLQRTNFHPSYCERSKSELKILNKYSLHEYCAPTSLQLHAYDIGVDTDSIQLISVT